MNDKLLARLEQLVGTLDQQVTKEDFVKSFENVIQLVLRIEKQTSDAVSRLEQTYQNLLKNTQDSHSKSLSDLKSQVDSVFVGNRLDSMQRQIDAKLASVKDGKDGKPGKSGKNGKNGVNGLTPTVDYQKIYDDVLNALQSGQVKLPESKQSKVMNYGISGGAKGRIHHYDLSSQCNGVLKTFSVPLNFGIVGVFSTQAPIIYRPLVDWTAGNRTLTLTSAVDAPATGQTLWISYIK